MTLIQNTVAQTLVHEISQGPLENSPWYAIQTMPKHERRVAAELQRKDLRAFLPLFPSVRQWSDRQRVLDMPLFPGYVFVQVNPTPDVRISVLRTSGVISFVGVRGVGVPIPESQITAVETIINQRLQCSPYPFLDIGQRVRIRGGSLEGVEGILTEVRGDQSLVISVALIQRSLVIRITGYRVEPV
jgi:transcription antitermination factor NusG